MYVVVTHFIGEPHEAPDVIYIFQNMTIVFGFWFFNRVDGSARAR